MKKQSPDTNTINRRNFIKSTTCAGAGLALAGAVSAGPDGLPTRVLGRTQQKVTILGLGTAPIGEGPVETKDAARIFSEVIDRGVTYVDTARGYGNAEEALGHVIPRRRDRLFVATKCWTDNAARAEESLNQSLALLKTDYVDLCHIHHIGGKNVDKVLADDGILAYLLKQKKAGKIRFIGLSGHARASRFLQVIETDEIDVVMTVLNYADRNTYEFESKVLPVCREKNIGVAAMKVYAGIKGGFPNHKKAHVGCATDPQHLAKAMAYALDLEGVGSAIIGPYTLEQAIQNVELAKRYQPLSAEDRSFMLEYGRKLAAEMGPRYGPAA